MYNKYKQFFSEKDLDIKIKKVFKRAGVSVIYAVLLLFYALKDENVPKGAKATIVGALGYFILPFDLVPDMILGVGYGDDLTALATAIGSVAMHISPETREKAREKCRVWFGGINDEDIQDIDRKLMIGDRNPDNA